MQNTADEKQPQTLQLYLFISFKYNKELEEMVRTHIVIGDIDRARTGQTVTPDPQQTIEGD